MDLQWFWWIAALSTLGFELCTRTRYLFIVALGFFVGWVLVCLDYNVYTQWFWAVTFVGIGCIAVYIVRLKIRTKVDAEFTRAWNTKRDLGVGTLVTIDPKLLHADGTANIEFRGATRKVKWDIYHSDLYSWNEFRISDIRDDVLIISSTHEAHHWSV